MKPPKKTEEAKSESKSGSLLALKEGAQLEDATDPQFHQLKSGIICRTDYRAQRRDRLRIVVEATDGFIPLWEKSRVLRWKFDAASLSVFQNPDAIKARVRELLALAIAAWGDAVPIGFQENSDNSDFRIVVRRNASCTPQGCTLASAFFPDAGRHRFMIYPTMFEQSDEEQVETMIHEIGHIFGLRHFFALTDEAEWPAEVFGEHAEFSIMNYGALSTLTDADKRDLKSLYQGAWSGLLTEIDGTPIKLVRPYHYLDT